MHYVFITVLWSVVASINAASFAAHGKWVNLAMAVLATLLVLSNALFARNER